MEYNSFPLYLVASLHPHAFLLFLRSCATKSETTIAKITAFILHSNSIIFISRISYVVTCGCFATSHESHLISNLKTIHTNTIPPPFLISPGYLPICSLSCLCCRHPSGQKYRKSLQEQNSKPFSKHSAMIEKSMDFFLILAKNIQKLLNFHRKRVWDSKRFSTMFFRCFCPLGFSGTIRIKKIEFIEID